MMSAPTSSSASSPADPNAPKERQPRGLGMLFFAEMWERFSFYGMRGLLVLYLVQELFAHREDKDTIAYGIYATYGALVYATPFIGGILADRVLGYKRAVLLGGVLMACGHAVMAIENELCLYLALAFLIAGNGFFKPNISSMVGGLYRENDPRRDGGFTIFYMGVNLGAFLQFIPGWLGENVSWSIGFGLAGIGMMLGLFVFYRGKGVLGPIGDPPNPERLLAPRFGPLNLAQLIYVGAFLSVLMFAAMVWQYEYMGYVLTPFALLGFAIVFFYALFAEKVVRERLFVVLILTAFNILFWAFFEQAGSSINLFTDRNVDRTVAGLELPTTMFQSVNPLMILALAIPFSILWSTLARRRLDPPIPVKFSLGLMQLGVGFLVLAASAAFVYVDDAAGENGQMVRAAVVPVGFLVLGYLLHTTGELCLSPIGLSMVTKLTPKKMVAMVMGLWFLSTSISHHVGGIIATFTSTGGGGEESWFIDALRHVATRWFGLDYGARPALPPGQAAIEAGVLESTSGHSEAVLASFDQLASYVETFQPIGWISIGAGVLLLVLSPLLGKWQHGVK